MRDKGQKIIESIYPMVLSRKLESYSLCGIKGLIFLMPFLPLYVTPSMLFPYISGKNFAFRIMVELAAALWLGLISINKEYRLSSSPMILSILFFTFIVGLADLFGVNPYKSFWSNYERMEGYITILHLMLYFMIIKSVFRSARDWKIFFNICVAVSVLVSAYALIAPKLTIETSSLAWEYGARVSGTIGNPPFLAAYLLLTVFLGFNLFINTQRLYMKFVYLLPIIINSIAIYFSASRGAILAVIIGAIIFSFFYLSEKYSISGGELIKKAVLSVIGILIVLSVVFMNVRAADFIKHDRTLSRFLNIFSDVSVQARFDAWALAWNGIKERPVLGWGQENFIGVYTVNPVPFVNEQIWVDRAHNIVIDWLVNAGVLGLFSYLAIYGTAFYIIGTAYQKKAVSKNEALIIITLLIGYFIQNLFSFDTINTYLLFFTVLAYIDSYAYSGSATDPNLKKVISNKVKFMSVSIAALAILACSGMSYYINYKPMKESKMYVRISANVSNHNSFAVLLKEFNNALSIQSFGDSLVRQGMKNVSFFIIKRDLFMKEGASKFIEATVSELEKEIAANPYDLESLTNMITSYMQIAPYEPSILVRTEALIRECMRLNPEYEWSYMALADVHFLKKDYELAFNIVRKIVERDPQNDKKQFKLALAAILISRDDVMSGTLANIMKIRMANNASDYNEKSYLSFNEVYQIAQRYNDVKNYQKALQYYKETMNSFPEAVKSGYLAGNISGREAQIRFEMASVYFAVGDKVNALKEAQRAAELDPVNFAWNTSKIKSLNN